MLIRSQDKKILVNLEQCSHLKIRAYEKKLNDKGKNIYAYNGGFGTPDFNCWKIETSDFELGEYSSEAKAIKVLDMMQSEYIRHRKCNGSNTITWFAPPKVFQMPQDSEVEE